MSVRKSLRERIDIKDVFALLLLIGICMGLIVEALYALPKADDWNLYYAVKFEIDEGKSQIAAIIEATRLLYLNHAGTFVSTLLFCLVNAFYRGGTLLHAFCCFLGVVVFFFSFLFFCNNYSKLLFEKTKKSHVLWSAIIILAGWLDTSTPRENFYWLICVFQYLLAMSVVLTFTSIIIGIYTKKRQYGVGTYIILLLLAFLSGGMGSQIPCISVGLFLLFSLTGMIQKKTAIVLLIGLGPSLILFLVSPANWGRAAINTPENETFFIHFWNGLKDTTRCIARIGVKEILVSPFFWILLIVIVCARLFTEELKKENEISGRKMIIRFGASIALIYSAVFPVCYSYRLSFLSPRTENVALLIIWILIFYWLVVFSRYIPQIRVDNHKKIVVSRWVVAILCGVFVIVYFCGDNAGVLAYRELVSGKPQLQSKNWKDIYEKVDKSDQPIVEINIDNEYISGLMVEHDQVDGIDEWVLARGYMNGSGKDKVVIRWHSEDGDHVLRGFKEPGYWIESW